MWGAIRNAAQAVTTDLGALTKETLSSAQQLLEKLDGQNEDGEEEEEEEDPDGRIDDGEEAVGELAGIQRSTETAQESPSRSMVTKLKKQLTTVKNDNKQLMTELQQVKTAMSFLKQGDGTENEAMINEMESLQRELSKYKELEELSQERDQLILTLGAENEGVNVRLAMLEGENNRLNAMVQEAVGKDDEINALRTLVNDLEQRAMKKLDAFHANSGGDSGEKEEMLATIQQLEKERDDAVKALRASLEAQKDSHTTSHDLRELTASKEMAENQCQHLQRELTLLQTEMKSLTEKQKTEAFFDAGSDAAAAAASAKPRSSVDEETILKLLTENKAMEVRAKDAEARAMLLEGNVASLQSMLTQLEVGKLSHPEENHDDRDDEHAMHVHNLQQQLLLASADTKDVEDRYQQLEMQLDGLKSLIKELEARNRTTSESNEEKLLLINAKDDQISRLIRDRNDITEDCVNKEKQWAQEMEELRGKFPVGHEMVEEALKATVNALQKQLIDTQAELSTSQTELVTMKGQWTKVTDELATANNNVLDFESHCAVLADGNKVLLGQVQESKEKIALMEEEKLAVEKTLASERQQHAKELELAQAEIQGLTQKQQQDKSAGTMTADAKKLAKKMEKQLQALSEEKTSAEAVYATRVTTLEQQLVEAGIQLEKQKTEADQVSEELRQQLAQAVTEIAALQLEIESLQTKDVRVTELEMQLGEVEKQLANAIRDKNAASAEQSSLLATNENRVEELQQQLVETLSKVASMEELNHKLSVATEEVTTLTRKLQASSEEKGKIVGEYEHTLTQSTAQYTQLQEEHQQCQDEMHQLASTLRACQASLEQEQGLAREAQQKILDNTAHFEQQLQATTAHFEKQLQAHSSDKHAAEEALAEVTRQQLVEWEQRATAAEKRVKLSETALKMAQQETAQTSAKIDALEAQLQERIVANAALHEKLADVSNALDTTKERLGVSEKATSDLQQACVQAQTAGTTRANELTQQLETALEELNYVKQTLEGVQTAEHRLQSALEIAQQENMTMRTQQADYEKRLAASDDASRRASEAEEALAKVDDKKRKDLENLKKQNERIALIQKAAAEAERVSQEQISDLKVHVETLTANVAQMELQLAERQQSVQGLTSKVGELTTQLIAATQQPQQSQPPPPAAAPGLDEMNVQIASLQNHIVMLEQALALAKLSQPVGGGESTVVPSSSSSSSPAATAGAQGGGLQEELSKMTVLYQQAQSRVNALEGERTRLEKEAKNMSQSLAESIQIHSPPGHSSTQRQRTTTGGDLENGCSKDSPDILSDNREEIDKKGVAGINPVVNAWLVQAWTSVRHVCPAALPYIGDRPPRIGLLGQGLVVYVLILHLYVLLFHARC